MTATDLKTLFEKDYNRADWTSALRDIFHIKDLHIVPHPIDLGDNPWKASALELGFFETAEGLLVGLYEVQVSHHKSLNGKVGLRNLMSKVYTNDADAALIVFSQGDTWRFSYASELTVENKETGKRERRQTDPKRYTYILGRHQLCRTAAERFAILKTSPDLFDTRISITEIEKAFSVDTLTKEFYRELSNWYFWALQHVQFPDDAEKDVEIRNSTNTIRLITRLIFVWFLKQKGLIPDEFFEKDKVFALLKHQGKNKSTYYKAILQNLFFATLNKEMGKREFRREGQHYNITNLFRYVKLFVNPSEAIKLFETIPFLNGGLFECLDKPHPTEKTSQGSEKIIRIDGFSDREDNKITFPDFLFFGGVESVDLSEAYGDKRQKNIKVRGIIEILNSYNFTVEENTPLDIQVALDPELLGKVFENLLASYNQETKTTARKQTGSFYTPREIVQYMVDESLKAYLNNRLIEKLEGGWRVKDCDPSDNRIGSTPEIEQYIDSQKEIIQNKVSELLSYSNTEPGFEPTEVYYLIEAIDEIKVLDPACGSGAFPMGILQQLVHIMQKIDYDNRHWKNLQLKKAQQELQKAIGTNDAESFKASVDEIMEAFKNNSNDYGRKLFLIENCIYGVDIQPIAVQIAKLRFFISLVCEQEPNPELPNLGIKPLPNLETKFVAANTLIGLNTSSTFKPDSVYAMEKELDEVRHRHFSAKTPETKRKYRDRDKILREQIAVELINAGFPTTSADQIANWNPYDQNTHSSFFDNYWMFGIEDGFDVVIGNPPYHQLSKDKSASIKYKLYLKERFETSGGRLNTFIFFIHHGVGILKKNGVIAYIIPNTILSQDYYRETRKFLLDQTNITQIVSYTQLPFENAVVENVTFIALKKYKEDYFIKHFIDNLNTIVVDTVKSKAEFYKSRSFSFNFRSNALTNKISKDTTTFGEICSINQAIALKGDKNLSLRESNPESKFYKLLDGRNINRYSIKWGGVFFDYKIEKIHSCKSKDIFLSEEKLFFRRVSSRLIFCYDDEQYFALNTLVVVNLIKNSTFKLKYLLGILNSKLMDYYYYNNHKSTKTVFSEIQARSVRELPIKKAKNQNIIIYLVDDILNAKSANPFADTSSIEKQIDEMVYRLYNLTYEEVKVVDPDFWLSEEEYELIKVD